MGELRLREHRAPLHGYWILPGGGASQTTESSEGGLFNIAQTKGVGSEMILASYLRYKERQPFWGVLWHPPLFCAALSSTLLCGGYAIGPLASLPRWQPLPPRMNLTKSGSENPVEVSQWL